MPLTRITNNVIRDETIVNSDISQVAEIAPSKLGSGQLPSGITALATGSTTARSLNNRFADVVNVKDFGATGLGTGNDRQAIIDSIAACGINSCLYFPQGTYQVDTSSDSYIQIPTSKTGLTILGNGAEIVSSNPSTPTLFRIDANDVTINSLQFDGGFVSGTTPFLNPDPNDSDIVKLFGQRTTITNCRFSNIATRAIVSRDGVGLVKSGGHKINNCYFNNCYSSIIILSTNNDGNTNGLSDYHITNNTIVNNGFIDNQTYPRGIGFGVFAGCPGIRRFTITGNHLIDAGDLGIEIFGSNHRTGVISNNLIECTAGFNGVTKMGVSLGGGDDISFTGNTVRGAQYMQLEIAQSQNIVVTGNLLDCKRSDGTYPTGSNKNCIQISNQATDTCDNLTITGNNLVNCITALFTNASECNNVVIDGNFIFADSTGVSSNPLNNVFATSGNRNNWIISNNLIRTQGTTIYRIFGDNGNPLTCRIIGNTFVGQSEDTAIGFGNNGWLDIQGNNFRDFIASTANPGGTFINTANVINVSYRNNLSSDYNALNKWIPDTEIPIQEQIRNRWWIKEFDISKKTPVVGNSGSPWNNWAAQPNLCHEDWLVDLGASSAAGWTRAGLNNFLYPSGSAPATIASTPFTFNTFAYLPTEGLSTTIIWGAQLNETGGALTARGIRLTANTTVGGTMYNWVLGIHNGVSEQTETWTTPYTIRNIVLQWVPTSISNIPQAGSKLYVWMGTDSGLLTLVGTLTLAVNFNSAVFAGGAFAAIGHSAVTSPGFTSRWGLAGMKYYTN
jgi:hypothetical protein